MPLLPSDPRVSSAAALIRQALERFGADRVVFASSLGLEDQVLIDLIAGHPSRPLVLTLDTGRLFPETYDLIAATEKRYGLRFQVIFPEKAEVERLVAERGVNLFYESAADRRRCCEVRKIRPLRAALAGRAAWITGLRREQSVTRTAVEAEAWDDAFGLWKVNPLWDWTRDDVRGYVRRRGVPASPLHDRGFESIGCAPCTRPVAAGGEARSGRWWWESPEDRECGLHASPEKREG